MTSREALLFYLLKIKMSNTSRPINALTSERSGQWERSAIEFVRAAMHVYQCRPDRGDGSVTGARPLITSTLLFVCVVANQLSCSADVSISVAILHDSAQLSCVKQYLAHSLCSTTFYNMVTLQNMTVTVGSRGINIIKFLLH